MTLTNQQELRRDDPDSIGLTAFSLQIEFLFYNHFFLERKFLQSLDACRVFGPAYALK